MVSPDAGGVKRAKVFQDGLTALGVKADLAMIIKQRVKADGESNQAVGQVSSHIGSQYNQPGLIVVCRWTSLGTSMDAIVFSWMT